ncbi:hypothetical protein D8674_031960 [Pyrus ussuriensis x Pyrus communis]|uniref:Uncharacterized protein n=1 Tax=Pyrus ussuriensis x Pyrus communis TaxID=2448454 RepID=A0A5N5F5R4_9ROSA|nr:hypothetical protein D8674_031960 [Pyrus ussuriensis x Pyrus communis]
MLFCLCSMELLFLFRHCFSFECDIFSVVSFASLNFTCIGVGGDDDDGQETRRAQTLLSEYNMIDFCCCIYRREDGIKSKRCWQSHGSEGVYDAFHLLQIESSVQRMVMALSSDTAVWDAVMNNEVVRELRESSYAGWYADKDNSSDSPQENSDDNNDKATNIVKWIFQDTMAKVMEAIEKITKVMGDLFQPPSSGNVKAEASNRFVDKLKTSFILSVVVLLIVVVIRTHKASP